MQRITIEHNPSAALLERERVKNWPIWSKEISSFPWHYDEAETCYVLEGDVTVTPDEGEPVRIGPGDFVTFPAGLSCRWEVKSPVRKHSKFG